jgi:hypothetical protein
VKTGEKVAKPILKETADKPTTLEMEKQRDGSEFMAGAVRVLPAIPTAPTRYLPGL